MRNPRRSEWKDTKMAKSLVVTERSNGRTDNPVLRVHVADAGSVSFPDGDKIIRIQCAVSAFGPDNASNVYALRVPAGFEFPAQAALRNAKGGLLLGEWVLYTGPLSPKRTWALSLSQQPAPAQAKQAEKGKAEKGKRNTPRTSAHSSGSPFSSTGPDRSGRIAGSDSPRAFHERPLIAAACIAGAKGK